MSIYPDLNRLSLEELSARFLQGVPKTEKNAHEYYHEVARLIRERGQSGIDFLLDHFDQVDKPAQKVAILYWLSLQQIANQRLEQMLIGFLSQALDSNAAEVTAEAIDDLRVIGRSDMSERIKVFLRHSSSNVRGSALRFLGLYYPNDGLELELLTACFQDIASDETYYYDAATLIRVYGQTGNDFLLSYFSNANVMQKRAILFALTVSEYGNFTYKTSVEHAALLNLLIDSLKASEPKIVAEAVDGLRRLKAKEALAHVLPLFEHSSPYVQSSVLSFVSQLFPEQAFPMLIKALDHPHYILRETAADELGDLRIEGVQSEALVHLRRVLSDKHSDVREAAQTAIQFLESRQKQ